MSDDEDDYLSDKFLLAAAPAPPSTKTYTQRRHEAEKRAQQRQEENRLKSRRERELEAREEGLSKSLFERAEEAQAAGGGPGDGASKALAMMMKMGFRPGQALGRPDEPEPEPVVPSAAADVGEEARAERGGEDDEDEDDAPAPGIGARAKAKARHMVEPLPLNEWAGRKGIGLGKRKLSPGAVENMAKAAKAVEHSSVESFRDTARREYEQRRADGRLVQAQRTCQARDEAASKTFNVLWLNPEVPESFPPGMLDALGDDAYTLAAPAVRQRALEDVQARLRASMQAHALQPLQPMGTDDDGAPERPDLRKVGEAFSEEDVEDAREFLRCDAQARLEKVLQYLRREHAYCFWCGTQYASSDELETSCPGEEEEDHD